MKFPTMVFGAAKAPQSIRKPCGNCAKIRAHLPSAIRIRLEAVEARMKNGKR